MAARTGFASTLAIFVIGGIIGSIVGALWIGPERVGELSEAAVQAISETSSAQVEAGKASDWVAWRRAYADDAVILPPNEPPVVGRAALAEWATGITVTSFGMTTEALDGCADLAVKRGGYSLVFTYEGAAEPVSDSGNYVEVWKRQADGSWRISVDIYNSSQPRQTPVEATGD